MRKIIIKKKFLKNSFFGLKLVIVGIVLVTVLASAVNLTQKNQDNRSNAAKAPAVITGIVGFDSTVVQDQACVNAGGKCQNTKKQSCENVVDTSKGGYVSGLCPSGNNDIKCCVSNYTDAEKAEKVVVKQDSVCVNLGGVCQSKKGGCNGKWVDNKCPSSDSKTIGCCAETDCNSTKCKCQTLAACRAMNCYYYNGVCNATRELAKNGYYCNKDSDCSSGKCAISTHDYQRVCVPTTGTFYLCDRDTNGSEYSEKWVNGKRSGSGTKCSNGCNSSTGNGKCFPGKSNRSNCEKNDECASGKCAITDSSKTRVCIPATGTVYVCDYYYKDSYSEKWVNGKQEGKGTKCKNGCKISTGKCN